MRFLEARGIHPAAFIIRPIYVCHGVWLGERKDAEENEWSGVAKNAYAAWNINLNFCDSLGRLCVVG